jgi:DNA-directed RNA polymerase subunit RPC12/RpoP
MKFDEIVKALRLCGETTECISERIGCPYCENTDDCKRELLFDAADIIEAQQQEIDRLQRWVNDLQSGMYVNCVYCGHRYGMENDTPVAMADVLKEHIEHCSKHPMSKLKQEIERLRDENISIRNWNACEKEQYEQLLESDKRRIKLEEQIEAQQREIKQLEYTLKKARDLIENANSNGICDRTDRMGMSLKEIKKNTLFEKFKTMSIEEMATWLSVLSNHVDYEDGDYDPDIMKMLQSNLVERN